MPMVNLHPHPLLYIIMTSFIYVTSSYATPEIKQADTRIDLETARVIYHDIQQTRVLDALVEAVNKATVSAQTSGRVSKIYFDVNDYAKKGDVLLRLRDKDQQAKLKVTQADYNQALTEFNRAQELYTKKLIARSIVDKAESVLKSTSARLEQAQENLEHTVVRAPYSGIMVKRHIEAGETAQPGAALFTGLSLESLRVAVNLPQDIINQVRLHKSARIRLIDNENKILTSSSMTISPYADADSHTFLVRVNLPEGDHKLYPGMAVKVEFILGSNKVLMVPASSIIHRSEVTAVYVMDDNQKLTMRQIRAGSTTDDNLVEVLAGLSENEQVTLDPISAVRYLKEQQ
ncbi:MAG: efflux RND transporter periplasmic adaptor subunit [Gammaproteobacteria bacterium]|nr:efflux RND transporter periplasmic adaptor subunit [Gammaproteobacteria bacterium]